MDQNNIVLIRSESHKISISECPLTDHAHDASGSQILGQKLHHKLYSMIKAIQF